VARMEAEPDLGILAFQAIGPEFPERMTEAGRLQGEFHCCSFAACGAAIRRSALARLDPLPEYFFHMFEESDLALRVWNAGYRVLQWNEIIVYHAFDPRCRNELRNHFLHARNEACSVIMRYPWSLLLPGLMTRLLTQFRAHAVSLCLAARLVVERTNGLAGDRGPLAGGSCASAAGDGSDGAHFARRESRTHQRSANRLGARRSELVEHCNESTVQLCVQWLRAA
jgi:hypothetical protein